MAGVLVAVLASTALSGVFAALVLRGRLDPIVTGVAVNVFALGITGVLHRAMSSGRAETLFAPTLPYITEEVWSWTFAAEHAQPTIHRAPWPTLDELSAIAKPDDEGSFDLAVAALAAINKRKSDDGVSVGRVTEHLTLAANTATLARLEPIWSDVAGAARCQAHELVADDALEDATFEIRDARFAEKKPKPAK